MTDKIDVAGDKRIERRTAVLNGKTYGYLLGIPKHGFQHTIFLIHGWPDLSMGWRYQIPVLLNLGFRVVCPDLMGFGRTEAPRVPPESIRLYTEKRAADDIAELARQLGASKIILGGHDWGGAVTYRTQLWHADLVSHIFVVCTPYLPPSRTHAPLEDVVETQLPNFKYQLQLRGPDVERHVQGRDALRRFLCALYGGRGPRGEVGFTTTDGLITQNLDVLEMPPLFDRRELEYYVDEYARNGIHGTLNWYRAYDQNFEDELELVRIDIDVPVLFVAASKDAALPPEMANHMDRFIPHLTRRSVCASHWALTEAPDKVNDCIVAWLQDQGLANPAV